jgi:ABC-2 type transport system ATP-binding protein
LGEGVNFQVVALESEFNMISCNDLSKQFGDFWAVNGVTLEVHPGEVLVLLGQNGAGKTTTVRMLTAVLSPTRGWAKVAGYDVAKEPAKVRSAVGVLTEQHGLYARMTAVEYLDYFAQVYGLASEIRKSRIAHLLEYFGLSQAANRRTGEYSKGMRQKLALARALIHEPPVLLLDEPTSAMDPESARLVRDHIADLRSSQRSIIICTHNLTEAEYLADKIAIIYQGRTIIQGSVDEIKQRLMGPSEYEIRLGGEWALDRMNLPDHLTVTSHGSHGFVYQVDQPSVTNPLLIQNLTNEHIPVISLQEVPRSLEQVYLEAMSRVEKGITL